MHELDGLWAMVHRRDSISPILNACGGRAVKHEEPALHVSNRAACLTFCFSVGWRTGHRPSDSQNETF